MCLTAGQVVCWFASSLAAFQPPPGVYRSIHLQESTQFCGIFLNHTGFCTSLDSKTIALQYNNVKQMAYSSYNVWAVLFLSGHLSINLPSFSKTVSNFTSFALNFGGDSLCAIRNDSTVKCFTDSPGSSTDFGGPSDVLFSPSGPFIQLSPTPMQDSICGLHPSLYPTCWGANRGVFLWVCANHRESLD